MLGVILMTLSSCTTQKKATKYFDEHPKDAADYCAVKFPVKETIDTIYSGIDSADYELAYREVWEYADSLLNELGKKPGEVVIYQGDTIYVPSVKANDRLRKEIEKELRKKLRPCIDSVKVITKTVENTAKVTSLQITVQELSADRDKWKAKSYAQRRLIFWLFAVLILGTLYLTRGLWMRLIKPL